MAKSKSQKFLSTAALCGLVITVCLVVLYAPMRSTKSVLLDVHAAQEPLEHPLSRRVRQAYPVFGAGEKGLTADTIDQEGNGPWTDWSTNQQCSRTCGGGVQVETRICGGTGCTGPGKRYVSCNTEPCPTEDDFRAAQCSKFDDTPLEGKFYKWKPYLRAPNKCELNCIPDGENFYYKWADKVIDGTRCDAFNYDICVEGYCVPVGCDNKLGSTLKEDRCRVCGGDGSTCKTIEGFFDETDLKPGYHEVIVIPAGATSILIQERKPTNNYLALRSEGGTYWLNGNWKIDFPQQLEAAGTLFDYERTKHNNVAFEKLYAKGPTKEPVVVVLLRQTENSGIQYEFSVALKDSLPYQYSVGAWSECSVTCGQGVQTRSVQCIDRLSKSLVDQDLCINSTMPELNRTCETVDCQPEWYVGAWESCSQSCGDSGMQYRIVYCQRALGDGAKMTVSDKLCDGDRPPFRQSCGRFACPDWNAGPWSSCSSPCGESQQYRAITCRSQKQGDEGTILPAKACNLADEPVNRRSCNLGRCEGLNWHVTEWSLCERCNDTTEYRNVTCRDETSRLYPDDRCPGDKPPEQRPCATPIACVYKWHSSQWSECSTECGHGHQSRTVLCAIEDGKKLTKMDESHCQASLKPVDRQNCTSELVCKGTYFTSDWEECSVKCGGGRRKRTVLCFDYDFRLNPAMCDEAVKPVDSQDCNTEPCPILCNQTEFGCCPDSETPALGAYMQGCSNCSASEYGCCPDNVTEALGQHLQGCSNCSLSQYGCCEDNVTTALGLNQLGCDADADGSGVSADNCTLDDQTDCAVKLCNYTDGQGVVLEVPCVNVTSNLTAALNETALDDDDLITLNVTTLDNATEPHCSKTQFGCCADWVTPAEGADGQGCPVYELGECAESTNATRYGCCPDNLTLARGAEYEGCGDPACAASLYGCCADRHTIAFGPHYKGCERAAVTCENTMHGCCADGKTAALDQKGTGCLENCVISKYGCCPDGKTLATGDNNAGCGCSLSQYGCCPDGLTAAEGPTYQGCPQGCATTHYGCCPDGKTTAKGPEMYGCPCRYTKFGCCRDGVAPASGPNLQGCDDCQNSQHGCCPDGRKSATGANFAGCFEAKPVLGNVTKEQALACALPADNGDCADYKLRWHYDSGEGVCRQFWYGGCAGNENRFASEAECKHVCIDPPGQAACHLAKVTGSPSCGPITIRWYYDSALGYCLQFYYNCNGNANNFMDRESCQELCEGVPRPATSSALPATEAVPTVHVVESEKDDDDENICTMPVDAGGCKGKIQQWYYEPATASCQAFNWGGCQGNANRFASKLQCEAKCSHIIEDFCKLPKDPGPCDQYKAKWYYKHEDGTCSRFYYGGCHGNANRFETMEECVDKCASRTDPCTLPSVTGPCAGRQTLYFFNANSQACEQFTYGGCLGNANRFNTVEECQQRCSYTRSTTAGVFSVSRVDQEVTSRICLLPKDTGPCRAYVPSYYYDSVTKRCLQFVYGGCQGNENRFRSLQHCQAACVSTVKSQNLIQDEEEEEEEEQVGQEEFTYPYDAEMESVSSNELDPYRSPRDYCNEPVSQGKCRGAIRRWHYNPRRGECDEFVYGGCGGNRNNFNSQADCLRVCTVIDAEPTGGHVSVVQYQQPDDQVHSAAAKTGQRSDYRPAGNYALPTSLLPDLCLQARDKGRCYGNTLNWYYDSESNKCETLMYTGCGGNSNRFTSEEACERACGLYRDQDVCSLPADEGPCLSSVPKWFYDNKAGQCSSFVYGGCEGNGNRFSSKEECRNLCHRPSLAEQNDVCEIERDAGPCLEPISQFYYDKNAKECRLFTYGGCRGNGNRFNTKEECESRCAAQAKEDEQRQPESRGKAACTMIFDAGPCHNSQQKWYYDGKTSRCRQFVYGGCGGNDNRFDSERECLKLCDPLRQYPSEKAAVSEGQRITLRVESTKYTYTEGDTVLLDCTGGPEAMHHRNNVVWYKDGQHLARSSDDRIQVEINGSLIINRYAAEDSGDYNCAMLQPSGAFSSSVRVYHQPKSSQSQEMKECVDNPALANCRLVVSANLCEHSYYGKYCCESCRSSTKKPKRSLLSSSIRYASVESKRKRSPTIRSPLIAI